MILNLKQLASSKSVNIKRKRRLRPIKPSRRNELWYKAELLKVVKQLTSQTEAVLEKFIKANIITDAMPVYDITNKEKSLKEELKSLFRRFGGISQISERLATIAAQRNLKGVDDGLISAIRSAIGVNISGMLTSNNDISIAFKKSVSENIDLITSIPKKYFEKLDKIVTENYTKGMRYETLIDKIKDVGNVTESRAKLIARDQTSKMASNFNEVRQQSLGIEKYIWQTSGDERVRPEHAEHDGKTFRWDEAPEDTGHPGEDIQCRCVAIPIFELE